MKDKCRLKSYIKPIDAVLLGLVLLVRVVYFFVCVNISQTVDTAEYIRVGGLDWLFGNIDRYRLPLYPLLIDICSKLCGEYYLHAVCLIQLLVSLISVVVLYLTLKKLTSRNFLYLTATALYGLAVPVLGWDKVILTESLSLSLTVFMIFGLVYYIKDQKLRYLAIAVSAAGLGALMRSVFAIYAGIIVGFLVIRLIFAGKKSDDEKRCQRIKDAKGLIFAIIPVIIVLIYCGIFYTQYGAFTLSDSGLGQQLSIVLENGYYKDSTDVELKKVADDILSGEIPKTYDKKIEKFLLETFGDSFSQEEIDEIKDTIDKYIKEDKKLDSKYIDKLNEYYAYLYSNGSEAASFSNVYRARCYIMDTFDRDRISDFISESKSANLKDYVFSLRKGALVYFGAGYENLKGGKISVLTNIFVKRLLPSADIYLIQALAMSVIELGVFFLLLSKKKQVEWIHIGFAVMILATGLLSILGTNAEFARTAQTMYPMVFAVILIWVDKAVNAIIKKEAKTNSKDYYNEKL